MLKRKLMKTSNENELSKGKEFTKKKKRAICAVAIGVLLLTGIGFGLSSLANRETTNTKEPVANTYSITEDGEEVRISEDGTKGTKTSKDGVVEELSTEQVAEEVAKAKEVAKTEEVAKVEATKTEEVTKEVGVSKEAEATKSEEVASTAKESTPSTEKVTAPEAIVSVTSTAKESTPSTCTVAKACTKKQTPTPVVTPVKETPSHSHSWSPVTSVVNHEAVGQWKDVVVKAAWTEEIPQYKKVGIDICNACDMDITDIDIAVHVRNHMMAGERGSHRSGWKKVQVGTKSINHPAVSEKKWVVEKKAWNETVTTGHSCNCGATK